MQYREFHPPHLYFDDRIYFITGRTINKQKFWNTASKKRLFLSCLRAGLQKLKIPIYAWVLLDNHYHLLCQIRKGKDIPEFVNFLNGRSSFELNKLEKIKNRKIWYQYWDHCIRNDADLWKHFNYIHHNPVKHGYVKTQEECANYQFCSYRQWKEKKGEEWLNWCFHDYPIADFTVDDED